MACEKDFISDNSDKIKAKDTTNSKEVSVLNDRLFFSNKASFLSYYESLKEKEYDEIATILNSNFYSKGFRSLIPILNDRIFEKGLQKHFSSIKLKHPKVSGLDIREAYDSIENTLILDIFISLLNQNGEIQIGDKIYKYTDAGLFFCTINEIEGLNRYLSNKQISTDFIIPSTQTAKTAVYNLIGPCGGMIPYGPQGEYFAYGHQNNLVAPCFDTGSGGSTGGGTNDNDDTGNNHIPYGEIAKELDVCAGNNPFLGNIFGTTKVCVDEFDGGDNRIKTKFYDIHLLLVYATGVKTKHQRKAWFWWDRQDTSIMALGVNSITWKFTPQQMAIPSDGYQTARYYLPDGSMVETLNGYFDAYYNGNVPVPPLPFADKVDIIIEIATSLPTGMDDAEDVREFFYGTLFDQAENIIQQYSSTQEMNEVGLVLVTPSVVWTQFYDFSESCTDCSKIERIIDWGVATPPINYNFGAGSGHFSFGSSWDFDFQQPDLINFNGYGMGLRSSSWHGNQMQF